MDDAALHGLTIEAPVPPRVLSPNARAGWFRRASAASRQRRDAALCAMAALGRRAPPRWSAATLEVAWIGRTAAARRMDQDNAIAALKSTIDGLVEAGILEDDRGARWRPVRFAVDRARPRLEITVRPAAPGEGEATSAAGPLAPGRPPQGRRARR